MCVCAHVRAQAQAMCSHMCLCSGDSEGERIKTSSSALLEEKLQQMSPDGNWEPDQVVTMKRFYSGVMDNVSFLD